MIVSIAPIATSELKHFKARCIFVDPRGYSDVTISVDSQQPISITSPTVIRNFLKDPWYTYQLDFTTGIAAERLPTILVGTDDPFEVEGVSDEVVSITPGAKTANFGNVALVTTGPTLIAAAAQAQREIFVQNLGPNDIEIGVDGFAITTGIVVAGGGGNITLAIATNLYGIATVANQASPADTRYVILRDEIPPP